MVVLTVGAEPDQRVFQVHQKLLCRKIEYFEKMLNGQFKEATTNSATFPEDDPECFDTLMGWVYHGRLPQLAIIQQDGFYSWNWRPPQFYVLADKFGLHELMDRVIDQITKFLNTCGIVPSARVYGMVHSSTPEGSPLRRLYSELFVYNLINHSKSLGDEISRKYKDLLESCPDLARDVVSVLLASNGCFENPGIYSQTCRFHIRKLFMHENTSLFVMGPGNTSFVNCRTILTS